MKQNTDASHDSVAYNLVKTRLLESQALEVHCDYFILWLPFTTLTSSFSRDQMR